MNRRIARAVFFYLPAAMMLLLRITSSVLSALNEDEAYSSNLRVEARHTAKDFAPDGDLSKEVWKKAKWIEFDLIFQRPSAHARDFGHALHRGQLRADVPILHGAQPAWVEAAALDGVPEDLSGRGRVGRKTRCRARRPTIRGTRQNIAYLAPR